jgi:hypothetical protein
VNVDDPSDNERLAVGIVPFGPEHTAGFAALVVDTLREFGFEPDAELDRDLDDPAGTYAALWIAIVGGIVVGSVALRALGGDAYELKRSTSAQRAGAAGLGSSCSRQRSIGLARTAPESSGSTRRNGWRWHGICTSPPASCGCPARRRARDSSDCCTSLEFGDRDLRDQP